MLRLFLNALLMAFLKKWEFAKTKSKIRNIIIFKKLFFILIQLNFTIHNRVFFDLVLVIFFFFQENVPQTKCTLQAKDKM
jgi:hypothetical protein